MKFFKTKPQNTVTWASLVTATPIKATLNKAALTKIAFTLAVAGSVTLPWQTVAQAQAEPSTVSQIAAKAADLSPLLSMQTADIANMRQAIAKPGLFQQRYLQQQRQLDQALQAPIKVPQPVDAGGGISHERHKLNYRLMYEAGLMYQLSTKPEYAAFVRDMLLAYSDLYPTLPVHPKATSSNKGKLFWQGLNDAVWLVYTIQAYDLVRETLTASERQRIESKVLRPAAEFLSIGSKSTFNKIHNHGTWSTAAVGMTGYVLADQSLVEQALLGTDKSGKGGFLRQLDELFSPEGYYSEGPYYQRYALLPFVTFAKAIALNEPKRAIFERRNAVLLKAIHTTIQLSYNKLFFPINDAIKDKGIDTAELVQAVALAYRQTQDPQLLDIAGQQQHILLTADGLAVAQALDAKLAQAYRFPSAVYGDGQSGKDGALVLLRWPVAASEPAQSSADPGMALLFKATAQGMGHGHFDKLHWSFYDGGEEIISDYGAARFLNVEAKAGGRYLDENESYAKQTSAHNTLVVDEQSHFSFDLDRAEQHHPQLNFVSLEPKVQLVSATMRDAYADVSFNRTMALVHSKFFQRPLAIDVMNVQSSTAHQYDLPLHYKGQLISTNFNYQRPAQQSALGSANGYQHFWLQAQATPAQPMAQLTFLNQNNRFYSYSSVLSAGTEVLLTQLGANDPAFNLRTETAIWLRKKQTKQTQFVNVLESHGEYNPNQEYTSAAQSQLLAIKAQQQADIQLLELQLVGGNHILLAYHTSKKAQQSHSFQWQGQPLSYSGRAGLFEFTQQKAIP